MMSSRLKNGRFRKILKKRDTKGNTTRWHPSSPQSPQAQPVRVRDSTKRKRSCKPEPGQKKEGSIFAIDVTTTTLKTATTTTTTTTATTIIFTTEGLLVKMFFHAYFLNLILFKSLCVYTGNWLLFGTKNRCRHPKMLWFGFNDISSRIIRKITLRLSIKDHVPHRVRFFWNSKPQNATCCGLMSLILFSGCPHQSTSVHKTIRLLLKPIETIKFLEIR